MNKTAWCLLVLLLFVAAVVAGAGFTIWAIEHYIAITPADWPYPGSLIDRANDVACGLILLPSWHDGRFCAWLVFFPVPIIIEFHRRRWHRVVLYLLCVLLPYSYANIISLPGASLTPIPSVLMLLLALIAPPFLIKSWSSLVASPAEKRLLRANLIVLWLAFCTADIMLGLGIHSADCKPMITRALLK